MPGKTCPCEWLGGWVVGGRISWEYNQLSPQLELELGQSLAIQMRQNSKWQNTNVTKHKKTKRTDCKYDKTQMWQYTKRQNTNMTYHKKTKNKCEKIQSSTTKMWQNAKRQNTNMTKCKRTKYKKTIHKYDKTQMWQFTKRQNTNMT